MYVYVWLYVRVCVCGSLTPTTLFDGCNVVFLQEPPLQKCAVLEKHFGSLARLESTFGVDHGVRRLLLQKTLQRIRRQARGGAEAASGSISREVGHREAEKLDGDTLLPKTGEVAQKGKKKKSKQLRLKAFRPPPQAVESPDGVAARMEGGV